MVCSLFHCFDPYFPFSIFGGSFFYLPLKWFTFLFLMNFLGWQVFFIKTGVDLVFMKIVELMWVTFFSLIKQLKKSYLILVCLIVMIFFVNVFGLVPFVFTFSSHLSFNMSFSISLWMSGFLLSLVFSVNKFLSHMVPTGTPFVLWSFLVLVETVSMVIRPMTLSIRLMANVMAGHLIVSLFGSFISSTLSYSFFMFLESGFLFFEVCVSAVQSYVFVSLLSLYWDES